MLGAVVLCYFRLRQLNLKRLAASGLAGLFALMPITIIHTVDLWSEGMYVALSLATLMLLDAARRQRFRLLPCFAAGLLVGCAMITRSVGIALLPAMFIVCLRAEQLRAWSMWIGLALLLLLISFTDMGDGSVSYADLLRGRYAEAPVARDALPYILFQWRTPTAMQWMITAVVARLMSGGLLDGLRRLQPAHALLARQFTREPGTAGV
jgi:hypothetical protein